MAREDTPPVEIDIEQNRRRDKMTLREARKKGVRKPRLRQEFFWATRPDQLTFKRIAVQEIFENKYGTLIIRYVAGDKVTTFELYNFLGLRLAGQILSQDQFAKLKTDQRASGHPKPKVI